jgi:hypothetical protein
MVKSWNRWFKEPEAMKYAAADFIGRKEKDSETLRTTRHKDGGQADKGQWTSGAI